MSQNYKDQTIQELRKMLPNGKKYDINGTLKTKSTMSKAELLKAVSDHNVPLQDAEDLLTVYHGVDDDEPTIYLGIIRNNDFKWTPSGALKKRLVGNDPHVEISTEDMIDSSKNLLKLWSNGFRTNKTLMQKIVSKHAFLLDYPTIDWNRYDKNNTIVLF